LKALIEVEVGIPVVEQILLHDGRELTNSQKLTECGVKENDVLVALHQSRRQLQRTSTPLQTQTQQSQLPSTRDNTEAQCVCLTFVFEHYSIFLTVIFVPDTELQHDSQQIEQLFEFLPIFFLPVSCHKIHH
jgi:hypothetical protein